MVYELLRSDNDRNPNIKNWCSSVKSLLCTLGFADAWLFQGVGNDTTFMSLVKQRLNDQFVQNWYSRLSTSSRAAFYRSIASFQFQPYLDLFNMSKLCKALSRLRMSSHRLQIEAGRWNRPIRTPVNERKCSSCNKLEDEFHFVLECDLYSDLRRNLIHRKYWIRPNMEKFISLINSTNRSEIRKLGLFIYKAFDIRNDNVYRT